MNIRKNKENGITLIALIITVIVMLILAGVAIRSIINTGLIDKTMQAVSAYNNSVNNEEGSISDMITMLNSVGEKNVDESSTPTPPSPPTVSVPDLTQQNLEFTYIPNIWTNEDVTVTISTTVTGYTLQYSTNGSDWSNYTTGITYTTNGIIYARLTDGTNTGNYVTGNITSIDKTAPVVGIITATTNSLTFNATDVGSGINGYQITTSNIAPISGWTSVEPTTSLESVTVTGLAQNTTYYVWVKDQAENVNVSKSIITESNNINITAYNDLTIMVGLKSTPVLTYTGTAKTISFSSSNTGVATIDSATGEVTGIAVGTATMTVTITNNAGVVTTKTCTITVQTYEDLFNMFNPFDPNSPFSPRWLFIIKK
ncbi:MAG: fibronectin type III domain-containing protein [Oscillospiraceae bacterium]|nr:fibronectin type III domain-containing protein [Oscillospiraceae bacterium]